MTTDQELLELAAKAAGIDIASGGDGEYYRAYFTELSNGLKRYTPWNPLFSDGDALRLAVKLNIQVQFDFVCVEALFSNGFVTEYLYNKPPTDKYAATRRAIVRAAAEIGRKIQ